MACSLYANTWQHIFCKESHQVEVKVMNTRQELLACVRNLPLESGKVMAPDVWKSFQVYWRGPVLACLRDAGDSHIHEPPVDNDLCLRYISRQKLLEFTSDDSHMMSKLNAELSGDRQYPFISDICGTFSNMTYAAIQTAVSAYRTEQTMRVQARVRNELWAIEVVGRQGQDLKHVLYLWLVEHLKKGCPGQGGYNTWLVHEARHDLLASDQPHRTHRLPANGRRVEDFILLPIMPIRIPDPILGDAFLDAY
jgi:hypothetical protein